MTNPRPVLLVGGGGTIGRILRARMPYEFAVLDLAEPDAGPHASWHVGEAGDRAVVDAAVASTDAVVFLATGQPEWDGLLETDMLGLKTVCESALEHGVAKLVYASSNHSVGMVEREAMATGHKGVPYPADAPVRPDGLYGVAKAFGEALCRHYAETTSLATSCVRIGTVQRNDDLEAMTRLPYFSYIPGGVDGVRARLRRTWLSHEDLATVFTEELEATDQFRLRFGISDNDDPYWSREILSWSPTNS